MKIYYIAFLFPCIILIGNTVSKAQATAWQKKHNQADSLYSQNKWNEAAIAFSGAYNQIDFISEEKGEIARKAGEAFSKASYYDKSEIWYKKSAAIYKELKMWSEYYDIQSDIARIIENKGRYNESIQISEKIIKWHTEKKDTIKLIKEYYNYAFYHYYTGNIQKAINLYTQTISLAEDKDTYTQAMCYNEMGNIWATDLNNEEKALECYLKSLQLKLEIEVPKKSISISCNNIGISYKNLGKLDSAMYYYRLALDYAQESGLPNLQINPLTNIANLQKKQGDFEASIKTFNQILEMKDITSIRQKINLYTNLGILYNQLNNHKKALENLSIAENLTIEPNNLIDRADIQTQKIIAYVKLKEYEKAFSSQEKLILIKDSIRERERRDEFADLLLKYETAEKNKTIAEQDLVIAQKESAIARRNIWLIVITMFCAITAITTGWYLHRKKVADKIDEEQKVNRAIFESEQKERIRIARDLHDSIGQKLSVMKMLLSKNDEANDDIKKITAYLNETANEVRNISHNLVPEILNLGFIKAVENLIEQLNESKKVNALLNVADSVKTIDLPPQTEVSLYRIVQEILSNIVRHSQTDKIFVKIFNQDNFLQILIQDKGVGFDTQLINISDGLGWKNIFARIKLVNGQINIKSQSGSGSEFLINIPVL
jgi:two-component system, NarL family, sensor kinase